MHPAVSVEGGEARPAAHLQPELGCVVRWILLGPPPRTHVDASRARASPLSLSLSSVLRRVVGGLALFSGSGLTMCLLGGRAAGGF